MCARRSNQLILEEINPEYSLEGLMLKLKFQYFGHLMGRANSLEKTLMLGKISGRRRKGQQRITWLGGITHSMDVVSTDCSWGRGSSEALPLPNPCTPAGEVRRGWLADGAV